MEYGRNIIFLSPKGGLILAEKGKQVYGTSRNSDKENITNLITVNAAGDFAPPLTIFKFDRLPASYVNKAPTGWSLGKSENGWMTAKTFFEYFANVLHPFFVEKGYEFPIIIFLDGHSSHLSLQLSEFCREKKIIVACLLANTTHILQPLDVAVFFPMECKWRKAVKKWRYEHEGRDISKQEVPELLKQILDDNSLRPAIIQGFRRCGLYPFDPNSVDYSKCLTPLTNSNDITNSNNKSDEEAAEPVTNQQSHFEYLETKIDFSVLETFRQHYANHTSPEINLLPLYKVWVKFKTDALNEAIIVDVENDIMEFSFPEFDILFPDLSTIDQKAEEKITILPEQVESEVELTTGSVNLLDNKNNEQTKTETQFSENKKITILSDIKIYPVSDQMEDRGNNRCKSEENINVSAERSLKRAILGDILVFPTRPNTPNKKKCKTHLPSVLTSDQWIAVTEKKEREKQQMLAEKEERKRKREDKKQKSLENKLSQQKKKATAAMQIEGNKESKQKEGSECTNVNEEGLNSLEKPSVLTDNDLKPGVYVIVKYDDSFYPGKIKKREKKENIW